MIKHLDNQIQGEVYRGEDIQYEHTGTAETNTFRPLKRAFSNRAVIQVVLLAVKLEIVMMAVIYINGMMISMQIMIADYETRGRNY